MLKALQLLLIPGTAWNRIVESKRGMASVVLISLLPLLVVVAAAEGYALQHWGLQGASSGQASALPQHLVVRFESIQFGLSLLVVFLGASMIRWLSDSFHFYPKFIRCFIVAAYGLSPIFVVRLLNCLPVMNIWISFALGVLGCVYVLYQGIGIVLEPEQTKGFGLYLLTSIIFALLSTMLHLINLMVLSGRI